MKTKKTKLSKSLIDYIVKNESITDAQILRIIKYRRKSVIKRVETTINKDSTLSLIKMDELFKRIPELEKWITPDMIWSGKFDYYFLISVRFDDDSDEATQYGLYLFTETTHHRIVIIPANAKNKGWISGYCADMLGEGMASIPDGMFTEKQMIFTFKSILAYELRTIEKKPDLKD